MLESLDEYLKKNYQSKSKLELERETGQKFYNLKYRAMKLGLKKSGDCKYCGKKSYRILQNEWICGNCYWEKTGKFCVDCGKEISRRSTIRCWECSRKYVGDLNRKHEQKLCPYCFQKINPQWVTCGKRQCKNKNEVKKGRLIERTCEVCKKIFLISKYVSETKTARFCSQKCYKEVFFPNFIKRSEAFRIKGIHMRSSWEVRIASLLIEADLDFEYEPKKFGKYIPDFYIPSLDKWIEVKGYMTKQSLDKILNFRRNGHTIYIINERVYNRIRTCEDIVQFMNRT